MIGKTVSLLSAVVLVIGLLTIGASVGSSGPAAANCTTGDRAGSVIVAQVGCPPSSCPCSTGGCSRRCC